ncbi:MAG: hypothetical protein EPN94_04980 [Nitrospirae bacterium]|nr:MAG: hypothetical protein EPN94_04980 [Nitrospirota bacterium]
MKIVALAVLLIFCFVFFSPKDAFAGTQVNVTVYLAGGFVVGGVAVVYSVFIGGDRQHSKKEKRKNEDNPAPVLQAFNYPSKQITEDEISQAGMVKILEW